MTCDAWEVVVVPFPFTDRATTKRRPALVLSRELFNRHGLSVLAMITSASHEPWTGDTPIVGLKATGLKTPSLVRLKLFTVDNRFIARSVGTLDATDRAAVSKQMGAFIPVLAAK